MDATRRQERIDAIQWYHDFDFTDGLRARSTSPDAAEHRRQWAFLKRQLDGVDFRGKAVLDVGCWDGFWSFYAERRGARTVLAADDCSQNWADGSGLRLAKELYGSAVEVNQDASVYRLASLNRRFDVILCLGVYYHLLDPFHAFAQLRHCCHRDTVLLIDGPEALALAPSAALFDFAHHACEWLPTRGALEQVLRAAYLIPVDFADLDSPTPSTQADRPGWRWRLRMCVQALKGSRAGVQALVRHIAPATKYNRRIFLKCTPFEGVNDLHAYPPPFGLDAYDRRFRAAA
jgi:tRNA (mo5U34)-methyltransferase